MHISHHRSDPSHIKVFAADARFTGQALINVATHWRCPVAHVGHIDRKLFRIRRDRHIFVGQDPGTHFTIKRKANNALSNGQHQHGLWAIDGIAGDDLCAAWLQKVFFSDFATGGTCWCAKYGEDGADRHVHIDI